MKIISLIIICGVLIFFGWDVIRISQDTLHQHQAESFPHVTGTVTGTEITTTSGSRSGIHYHAHVSYRYAVSGTEYQGRRYRYDGHPTDEASVNAIITAHPIGSAVEVYYNPEDPRDTVLTPDVDASDVSMPLLLLAIMLFLLYAFLPACRNYFLGKNPVAGGVKIISDLTVTRARLPRYEPAALGLAAAAGLAVLAAILVGTGALHPPWLAGQWSLGGILAGGMTVYTLHWCRLNSGRQDLVMDRGSRMLRLPSTFQRKGQTPLSFTEIRRVFLDPVEHRGRGGPYYTYMVTLERSDGTQEELVDLNEDRAEEFTAWLREKLGVSA